MLRCGARAGATAPAGPRGRRPPRTATRARATKLAMIAVRGRIAQSDRMIRPEIVIMTTIVQPVDRAGTHAAALATPTYHRRYA